MTTKKADKRLEEVAIKVSDIYNQIQTSLYFAIPLDVSGGKEARMLCDDLSQKLVDGVFEKLGIESKEGEEE